MPRIIKPKTNLEIQKLSTQSGDHYVGGTPGLFLRVKESGCGIYNCTWHLADQRFGRRTTYTLKRSYPECSVRLAREIALQMRRSLSPNADKTAEQVDTTARELVNIRKEKPITVEQAMMEFLDTKEKTWKKGTNERKRIESVWRKHMKTILWRPIHDIVIQDMEACLKKCHQEHYPTFVKHVPRLGEFFKWTTVKGYRDRDQLNPCDKQMLSLLLPKPAEDFRSHSHPSLPIELIPDFFAELIEEKCLPAYCLMLLILTGVRPGNSVAAEWKQFNEDFTIWTVRASNMKVAANGQHRVPLASQASQLLKFLKSIAYHPIYVFPSIQRGKGSITTASMCSLVKRMHEKKVKEGKEGWVDKELSEQWEIDRIAVPHGTARAGISTWNFEYNISDKRTIDLILHHSVAEYKGAYDRAKNMDKKQRTLQLWADYCFSKTDLDKHLSKELELVKLSYIA